MTQPITEPQSNDSQDQHKHLALLVYVLQALGFVTGGLTSIAGLMINYFKRSAVRDTWLDSHFRWQLNTFWYGLLWTLLAWLFWLVLLGWVASGIVTLWIIYRIVKGVLYLHDDKPIIF